MLSKPYIAMVHLRHATVCCLRFVVSCFAILLLCNQTHAQQAEMETVEINNFEDLNALFRKHHYTPKDWQAGIREVPRIYLDDIPSYWRKKGAKEITVQDKKRVFFRLLAPIVLYVNELILQDRKRLQDLAKQNSTGTVLGAEDLAWLQEMSKRYLKSDSAQEIDDGLFTDLLRRVDIVPTSLALAQGAVESGWGTSRFADEGNSLFGQWSWSGGIKPAQQREQEHGDHRIAAFESTGMSVWSYMLNLNTHAAYASFRQQREQLRAQGKKIHGKDLVATLTAYSERGEEYVKELRTIMRQNKLDPTDDAHLKPMTIIRIIPAVQ